MKPINAAMNIEQARVGMRVRKVRGYTFATPRARKTGVIVSVRRPTDAFIRVKRDGVAHPDYTRVSEWESLEPTPDEILEATLDAFAKTNAAV